MGVDDPIAAFVGPQDFQNDVCSRDSPIEPSFEVRRASVQIPSQDSLIELPQIERIGISDSAERTVLKHKKNKRRADFLRIPTV